jgi:hypothetical protein
MNNADTQQLKEISFAKHLCYRSLKLTQQAEGAIGKTQKTLSASKILSLKIHRAVPSFTRNCKIRHIIEQIPADELDQFNTIGYTIAV